MTDKAKILLVDDREENLVALEAILGSVDHALVSVRSGEAALKALLTDEFAVILLDVVMPGMDGFETATHIKRRAKTRDIPIIFLTAVNADPDYAFRGYAAGAVDYIAKPFDPWVLRAKVPNCFARSLTGRSAAPTRSWRNYPAGSPRWRTRPRCSPARRRSPWTAPSRMSSPACRSGSGGCEMRSTHCGRAADPAPRR